MSGKRPVKTPGALSYQCTGRSLTGDSVTGFYFARLSGRGF